MDLILNVLPLYKHIGADKLGMPETTSVVLEEDGTEIDEESFNYLPDGTTFILLRSNEKWRKPEGTILLIFHINFPCI